MDPEPYIADLTFFTMRRYKLDLSSAKRLKNTFRLIDGLFQEHVSKIYPDSLVLNKENSENTSAHVLDLNINVIPGKFIVGVYDKRDD